MTRRTGKRRFTVVTGVLLVIAAIAWYVASAFSFLSPTRPVPADILVVEGWLPEYALEQAAREFHRGSYRMMLVTGFPYTNGVLLGMEGSLVFRLPAVKDLSDDTVSVTLDGTKACGAYAHFKVYADSLYLGDAWSTRKSKTYSFPLNNTKNPSRISVVFDNDCVEGSEDRNLRVKNISLGGLLLPANDTSVTFYFMYDGNYGPLKQMSHGSAGAAAAVLKTMVGRDSLVTLETNWKTRSKTYTTAVDVRKWIDGHIPGQVSVNVWSMDLHARRTWTSYRKVFGKTRPVGIISCPDTSLTAGSWWKSPAGWKKVIRETIGQIYIFFVG
jgi:hypothetical protein